jgi:hypothetical protein
MTELRKTRPVIDGSILTVNSTAAIEFRRTGIDRNGLRESVVDEAGRRLCGSNYSVVSVIRGGMAVQHIVHLAGRWIEIQVVSVF